MTGSIVFSMAEAIEPAPLAAGVVRIWATRLDGIALGDREIAMLDTAERERMSRFRLDLHRRRYGASHVFLRRVLAACTGREPASLTFTKDINGKPALLEDSGVHFNFTHSGETAACAVGDEPLGIDIESLAVTGDLEAVAARFFSAHEVEPLAGLSKDQRTRALCQLWTRHEAALKATGRGLQDLGALKQDLNGDWRILDLKFPEHVVGAIAVSPRVHSISAAFVAS